jgi:MFS family permease
MKKAVETRDTVTTPLVRDAPQAPDVRDAAASASRQPPSFIESGRASPWRALSHRNFALFLTGHGMSLCGTWMQSLAQAWLVYRLTGSPFLLGLVEFLSRAPILGLAVVGGLLADRWPRHRLMFFTQGALLVQAAALAGLTLTGSVTIEWILALALFLGLISAVEVPVRQSFMTELVPKADIPSAIGLNSSMFNAARIIGPALAGVVVAAIGEGPCFLINAVSFMTILGCLAAMRIDVPPRRNHADALSQLAEGFRYARRTPHVRAILMAAAVLSVAAMPFSTLLPVFAGEILRGGPGSLGLLMGATGLGALAAALRLARRPSIQGLGSSIARALVLFSGGLLALAASQTLWVSVLALIAAGFGMVSAFAGSNTLIQSLAPEDLRGRAVSLYTTASLGFTIFGSILAGVSGTYLGAPLTVAIGGLLTLITAWVFWQALPDIRHYAREHQLVAP